MDEYDGTEVGDRVREESCETGGMAGGTEGGDTMEWDVILIIVLGNGWSPVDRLVRTRFRHCVQNGMATW